MALITLERTVSLDTLLQVESLYGVLFNGEKGAHRFLIHVIRDGEPVTLNGSISCRFLQPDGGLVTFSGSVSEGAASVTLPQACYAVPGRFSMAIYVTENGATTAVYAGVGNIFRETGSAIIDPGTVIPSVEQLLSEVEAVQTAIDQIEAIVEGAVSYSADAPALTEEQKAQARANIGGVPVISVNVHNLVIS